MSLFSSMRTSVSGMAAQSSALSAISDNIANASTTGYKEASTEFETILGQEATSTYESGGVQTDTRYGINTQGTLTTTTSSTDLAINGNGFFVVSQGGTGQYLTRAGSFVENSDGTLVNTAGYELMGNAKNADGTYSTALTPVTIPTTPLAPVASTSGTLSLNLPSTATAVTGDTPADNKADSTYTDKTSVTVYDNLGTTTTLDVYLTKTGDNTWEATAYNQADASSSGGFPYSSAALGTQNLTFDATTGKLTSTPTSLSVAVPNGNTVKLDMSGTTQYASAFSTTTATANGNAASKVSSVSIGTDGIVTAVYANGSKADVYQIPLATVASPDNLTPLSGNVYQTNTQSGDITTSTAGSGDVGTIQADSLEESTVDIATELTNMIVAQRAYEANSKVLQTASDLLGVINRLSVS